MIREKTTALQRARKDLAAGRPDKARDRLTGYLYTLHQRGGYSEEAYLLLGDALFEMKDFSRAGAAWLLTERDDDSARAAVQAFNERNGTDAAAILNAVKPRAPSEVYPPKVRERLGAWNYRYVPYRSRKHPRANMDDKLEPEPTGLRPIEGGCLVFVGMAALFVVYYCWQVFYGRW